jgi:transcriptional regulator with XRE-family HTH domain
MQRHFGERLRALRDERHWTQQELADKVGVRYETICRLEYGRNMEPRLSVALSLARALGVTLDYLAGMYDVGEQRRSP